MLKNKGAARKSSRLHKATCDKWPLIHNVSREINDSLRRCFVQLAKNANAETAKLLRELFDHILKATESAYRCGQDSSALPKTLPVRTLLCKAGTPDATGNMVTPERLDIIMKAYKDNGVPVERVGDEIWYESNLNTEKKESKHAGNLGKT